MRALVTLPLAAIVACASSSALPESNPVQMVHIEGAGSLSINPNSSPNETTVPYTVAQVWAILPAVYDSLGIPLNTMDASKHLIGNVGYKTRQRLGKTPLSRYFDCGTTQIGPNADSYDVFLTVLTQVVPGPAGAKLATSVEASARPLAFSQAYSRCSTTPALETRLRALVMQLAGQSAGAKKPI